MQKSYKKTHHFLLRAWERGYYQKMIDKIMKRVAYQKGERLLVIGTEFLKKVKGCQSQNVNLIIKIKNNVLITLFEVKDLFYYLKSVKRKEIVELIC